MVSVREEARMLVSAVAREARRCPPPTAGPCWFLPTPCPPSPSEVDWGLREVSWAPHRALTEQLCHLTRFWDSSASLALSSTSYSTSSTSYSTSTSTSTSRSCQVAATLRTVPCGGGGGKSLTLTEVLRSLSGQIELFYLATHAGLQSLRYFCCFAIQPGLHPGLQEDLIRAVDKAYETLVVGVWRCSRVNARLQAAYQTSPESFHESVLTPTPTIFSIAQDSEDEDDGEGMEEDVCIDDDDPDDSMLDDHDDPPPPSSLGDPLEDAKSHYLRLIVGDSMGKGWGGRGGGPQGVAGTSVVTSSSSFSSSFPSSSSSTSQPLAPRVLVGREPLERPSGFMPFQKPQQAAEEEEERMRAQVAVQDDPFAQACDAEVWSCFGPLAGGRANHAAGGRSGGRTGQTENGRDPTRASSAPKDVEALPALTRIRPSKAMQPTTQRPTHRPPSLLPESTPVACAPRAVPPPSMTGDPILMPPAGESWSSAFRVIHPRSDGGAKPVANTSPGAGGLVEASAASQATPSHVGVQGLLADGLHVNSAFSRVLQPAPQPVPHSQPSNPPLSRLQLLRWPLPPPPSAKTNKRPRCVDKKNECQEDGSGVVSTTSGRGGPAPEGGIDGAGGEKAPKRARRRLEDHAARMQQHFLSLVDAISSHSLEPPETKGAGRGSSSKAVRKPRLRASQLRKRD